MQTPGLLNLFFASHFSVTINHLVISHLSHYSHKLRSKENTKKAKEKEKPTRSQITSKTKADHLIMTSDNKECVGTLLVNTKDVQELSDAPALHFPEVVNLKKRMTGTLMVNAEDLATHKAEPGTPTLARRVTERLQGPAPPVEETEELDY
jgi:hypothetical protein